MEVFPASALDAICNERDRFRVRCSLRSGGGGDGFGGSGCGRLGDCNDANVNPRSVGDFTSGDQGVNAAGTLPIIVGVFCTASICCLGDNELVGSVSAVITVGFAAADSAAFVDCTHGGESDRPLPVVDSARAKGAVDCPSEP